MMRSNEFAHQLCFLYDTLPKETKNRNYVNKWLTTLLSDKDTTVTQLETITKKIRDEVIGMSKKQQSAIDFKAIYQSDYFRRSNFYVATKVILQLSLTHELGADRGRFVFKVLMLQFITQLCEEFENPFSCPKLDIDLMTHLLSKIARRIEKMYRVKSDDAEMLKYSQKVIDAAKEIISKIRVRIDKQIKELQTVLVQQAELKPLNDLNFGTDIYQKVPKLRDHLEKRKSSDDKQDIFKSELDFKCYKRHQMHQTTEPILGTLTSTPEEIDRHLYLTVFENCILYELQFDSDLYPCETLSNWFKAYAPVAEIFHLGDPFGVSKMMLLRLKLVAMIDRMAANNYQMLLEHHSGIDPDVFDVLLLPQSIDMKIAFDLQNYFQKRNVNAQYPGLIEQHTVSSSSFSVRYAKKDSVYVSNSMAALRREIEIMGEKNIERKKLEWKQGRAEVNRLRNQASLLSHEYYTYKDPVWGTLTRHRARCTLCTLNNQIDNMKICQYERPLPLDENEQNAIVFELRIPREIALLRDILSLSTKYSRSSNSERIVDNWISNHQICHLNRTQSRNINLGTSSTISMQRHHVDSGFSIFVVNNGWNCLLHDNHSSIFPCIATATIKKQCTLSVESSTSYAGMQWTMDSTSHTQNQVLARQSECSQNLSLSEFKAFGSLRADGHRLQLRKLYATIETEALSFDQHSVLALILQSMWETGTIDESDFVRGSHIDFIDSNFTNAMIDLLDKFIEQQKDNWAHPVKLLLVTFITVRMYELNSDLSIALRLVDLLNKIRTISTDWFEKIQQALNNLEYRDQSTEQPLRLLLVIVSVAGAMTFFINSKHEFFDEIFKVNLSNGFTAPRTWLLSIVTLNNNILLNSYIKNAMTPQLKMLIRLIRYTGIHIESKIRQIIQNDPNDVFELIKDQWSLAMKGEFKEFHFAETCPQVFIVYITVKGIVKNVTIDLITGSFLVNKLPIARLPNNITSDPLFQRVFGDYIFEVQPDASNSFTTVHRYKNCSYEFGWAKPTELIITEYRIAGDEIELVPISCIRNDIPEELIDHYSHWWHKDKNVIEFRPIRFQDKTFSIESGIAYTLDLNANRLIQMNTGRFMLDINSVSYQNIQKYLLRLERKRYVHVFMDEPSIAKIELIRMNLKFKIDESKPNNDGTYDMLSNEFSKMKVSWQQNCGTLYGLNQGLLLESVQNENSQSSSKFLILPHSTVTSTRTDSHISVNISLHSGLRNPPFHLYQVDEIMRQLKPTNSSFSAWFYLAYLHAITSHGEIEPLTGISGTERALQILQSSFVWSWHRMTAKLSKQ